LLRAKPLRTRLVSVDLKPITTKAEVGITKA